MSTFAGIDLGTTATKVVVIDEAGAVVARGRCAHPRSRAGGTGRVDPSAWVESIKTALQEVQPHLHSLAGVGIDVHCPVVVPLGQDGRAVGNGVLWDNKVLGYYFNKFSKERSEAAIAATGNRAAPSTFVAVAAPYLVDHDPQTHSRMHTLGMAGTWLGALLTGEVAVDPTQASYTGIYDTISPERGWIQETVDLLGIDERVLPPVRQCMEILGSVTTRAAEEFGLPAGIPVTVGSADTPAASYALGTRPGEKPFFIIGTTHVINSCLASPDIRATALQRRGTRPGEWLINGVSNGGDALAVGARLAGYGSEGGAVASMIRNAYGITADEALTAPYFIPHVMQERGPLWFDRPCARILEITRDTTENQMARAVVDGVMLVDRMILRSCVPREQGSVYLTGSFGSEERFPQMLADILDADLDLVDESYLPAIGAAGMCGESVEGLTLPEVSSRRIRPRPEWVMVNDARWDVFRTRWSESVGRELIPELDELPHREQGMCTSFSTEN